MPNPKLGTVTPDVAQAVNAAKSGTIEYRADKGGVVHAGVGKVSFGTSKLFDNVKTLVQTIIKAKPQSSKGTYMKSVYMSATMGPSVKLHTASLNQLNS